MSDSHLIVRPARKADWETMIAIADRAFLPIRRTTRAALGDLISDVLYPAGDERSKGLEVRRFLETTPENALVCESGGKIVGFLTYRIDGAIGTISNNAAEYLFAPLCNNRCVKWSVNHIDSRKRVAAVT